MTLKWCGFGSVSYSLFDTVSLNLHIEMMKEPTWGVKAAYGRVTPHLGSFYSLYRHVSRFRKI